MIKEKECKGTGITMGYGCGTKILYRKYGLCSTCQYDWATTNDAGKVWFSKQLDFKKKKNEKDEKTNYREKLTNYRDSLQTKVQLISRLIDIGLPCLAKNIYAKQIHGGHIFSKGSNKTISLNLHNIHRQSAQSNHFQNDDGLLREGLQKEYGMEYYNFISELRQTPSLNYTNYDYMEFYKKASKIALRLKKDNVKFNLSERIKERNNINIELGIYDEKYCIFVFNPPR